MWYVQKQTVAVQHPTDLELGVRLGTVDIGARVRALLWVSLGINPNPGGT